MQDHLSLARSNLIVKSDAGKIISGTSNKYMLLIALSQTTQLFSQYCNNIPIIMNTIKFTTHIFAGLGPPKAAGKENKQKVQKKLKCLKATGKENKQIEPVKDKSQVKKKLTCLRCCQCVTCNRKRFSTKRIEIALYDPSDLAPS